MKDSMDLSWSQMVMAVNTPMLLKASLVDGHTESGVMASGQVVGVIDDLPTCRDGSTGSSPRQTRTLGWGPGMRWR